MQLYFHERNADIYYNPEPFANAEALQQESAFTAMNMDADNK